MFFKSITNKIFIGIFVISVIFLTFALSIISKMYVNELEKNEVENNLLVSNKTKTQFDLIINMATSASDALTSNANLKNYIDHQKDNDMPKISEEGILLNLFQRTLELQPVIYDIHLLDVKGNFLGTNTLLSNTEGQDLFEDYFLYDWLDEENEAQFKTHFTPISNGNFKMMLSHITPIYKSNSREIDALLILDLDYDFMFELFMVSTIQSNEKTMVVSQSGDILFNFPYYTSYEPVLASYPEILETTKHNQIRGNIFGIDSVVVADKMDLSDWIIVRIVQLDKLTHRTRTIKLYSVFIIIASCVSALLFGAWLIKRITKPITELDEACKKIEGGDFSFRVEVTSNDEIGNLQSTINLMLDKINDYFQTELSDQKRKSQMEMQIFQAQINPHFLYNTLDSLKWMAVMQNVNNIAEMSSSLINLLKYNLGNIEGLTTLKDELSGVKNYITIQKYRYGDSFEVEYEIDENTLDCKIVPFTIQPLVENCIIHAFDDIAENNVIKIKAFKKWGNLYMQIEDNGNGMSKEQMEELVSQSADKGRFSQIGIKNIIGRIQLEFGEEYGLTYKSRVNIGTLAEVVIPIVEE